MLKKLAAGLFLASLATAGIVAWRGDTLRADNKGPVVQPPGDEVPNGNAANIKPAQKLPITQVVLFNSGVGYFNRSGEVEGDARVDLEFSAGDINDLIKSLVIQDGRGKPMPLRYDSQEPIEKTLKSFAIDLSANPSFGQILNQMRGQKVEVTLQTNNPALNGLPGNLTGTIVGMETAHRPHSPTAPNVGEMELLNLACAEGLRSVPLAAVQRVRFLNPTVENEFRRALEVVAVGHDSLKKTVHLGFAGDGKREVKVGYVVENPIWKTSYRLVKGENGKWRLQAWANVENTSDEDWADVKLTLVSSRPISFQMDLYPPLFIPRPTVEPALFASLRPPTYGGPITNAALNMPGFGVQGGAGFGGFGGGGNFANNANPAGNPMMAIQQGGQTFIVPMNGQLGGQFGQQGFQGGNTLNAFNNRYANDKANLIDNNSGRLNYQQMQEQKKNQDAAKAGAKVQAQQLGSALVNVDADFVERARAADELGQPARFTIDQKVSLPRQQSVMLPILDEEIEATKVSIYNDRVHAVRPLHGLKIKNKTKQALMSGPVTVYEGEQPYSGDARLLDLQPNEERYLSYALDTGIEIKTFDIVKPGPEMTAKMEGGKLHVQYKLRTTRTYVVVNRSPEPRKVVLEQPVRTGWKLVKPEKPAELTADLYRFEVDVKAGETVRYEVAEELPRIDPFENTKQADWTGFATSLGLDVWTENERTPEDSFVCQVAGNNLLVTHLDRRATTYYVKNRADEDRIVWLEHNVPTDRVLIGKDKPVAGTNTRYKFKLELKKGETGEYTVSEESKTAKAEAFAMQGTGRIPQAKANDDEIPTQRFVTELGFDLWQVRKTSPESLVRARFVKGELHTWAKDVETITYHVRNKAAAERTFTLEHMVRPSWGTADEPKPAAAAGRCVPFTVKAAGKTIAKQPVAEERVVPRTEAIDAFNEDRLKAFAASPAVPEPVKAALTKAVQMRTTLLATGAALKELQGQLKDIIDEQTRLRTTMEKLPQSGELYKRLEMKLGKEETTLEKVQADLAQKVSDEKKQSRELASFLEKLTTE
jgi:hypothetical protein